MAIASPSATRLALAAALAVLLAGTSGASKSEEPGGTATAAEAAASSPVGNWRAAEIAGKPMNAEAGVTLDIAADGQVSGNNGCNPYGGLATIEGDKISFSQMRSGMMACVAPGSDHERALNAALAATKAFRVDGGTLVFLDEAGATLASFSPR